MNKSPIIVNLYGGPGTGKSTTCAGVFSLLKLHGVNAEIAPEFAKDLTWEKRHHTLRDQYYVWGKQYHRLFRLKDDVDVVITDSPLLLSLVYCTEATDTFKRLVVESFNQYNNVNFFLKRVKKYNPKGRNQTEGEARSLDTDIRCMLDNNEISYYGANADWTGINFIAEFVLRDMLGREGIIFHFSEKI